MARKRYSDEDKQTIQPRFHYLVEFVFGVASDFDVAQSYGAVNRPDKGLVPRSSIMGAAQVNSSPRRDDAGPFVNLWFVPSLPPIRHDLETKLVQN